MAEKEIRHLPSVEKPWLKFYSEEAQQNVVVRETIYERLVRYNKGKESVIALNYLDKDMTYKTMLAEIEEVAASFKAMGVKKGEIVACLMLTVPEAVIAMYALNKLGAAIMLLDPRRAAEEFKLYTTEGNVRFIMLQDIFYPRLKPILPELKMEKVIISPMARNAGMAEKLVLGYKTRKLTIDYSDKIITYDSFLALGKGVKTEAVGNSEFELAAVTFSGGTTGIPKGIMLSNLMMNAVTEGLACLNDKGVAFRSMGIVPIFTSYGLACAIHGPLAINAKVILIPNPDADKFGGLVKKYKPTNIVLVPGFYEKFIESKCMKGVDMGYNISCASGGDSMSPALEERVNAFLKEHGAPYPHVAQGYGMSEMCSIETVGYKKAYKFGSVGVPMMHVNLCICEPGTTKELGYNQEGEICGSGLTMMLGYLNNPEETARVLIEHEDGQKWIHSGDLGYIDEDGFLFFTGRLKRVIPRPDGHKVAPIQLEHVVSKVPNVEDCACVGVRDGVNKEGLMPVVALVLKDKAYSEPTIEAAYKALESGVEVRSMPMDIYVIDEMPRIGMGKIDYKAIANDYMDAHGIKH